VTSGEGRSQVGEPPWGKGGVGLERPRGVRVKKKQGPVIAPVFLFKLLRNRKIRSLLLFVEQFDDFVSQILRREGIDHE